ncbi:hypothetical protein ACFLWH_01880 [Chloroflexota bacterium]
MSAETFAIIGALAFATSAFVLRRAVLNVPDTMAGVVVSTSIGLPFFCLFLLLLDRLKALSAYHGKATPG